MKENFVKTVRKSGTSLAVNIPHEIIKLLNLKKGDIVKIEIQKRKKAQITAFMLIGITIMAAFGFLYLANTAIVKLKIEGQADKIAQDVMASSAVKHYVSSCLDIASKDALKLIGQQGGFIYKNQNGSIIPWNIKNTYFRNSTIAYLILLPSEPVPFLRPLPFAPPPHYPCYPATPCKFLYWPDYLERWCPNCNYVYGRNLLPGLYKKPTPFGFSIQRQLEQRITNKTKSCVEFDALASISGYNITGREVITNVTISENNVIARVYFPLQIRIQNYEPVIRMVDFQVNVPVRLKVVYELVKKMIKNDNEFISYDIKKDPFSASIPFSWQIQNKLTNNITIEKYLGVNKSNDVVLINDTLSNIDGKPYIFQFAVQNRIPALEYIGKPNVMEDKYDLIVAESGKIILEPHGYDPDEDNLTYNYSGWKETWNEYFKIDCCEPVGTVDCNAEPEKCIKPILGEPHNWTLSQEFKATNQNASYTTNKSDIGPHNLTITISDGIYKDWQLVKILVNDLPKAVAEGNNFFNDILNKFASIEDPYKLDASKTVNIFSTGLPDNYKWIDTLEPFLLEGIQVMLEPDIKNPTKDFFNITNPNLHNIKLKVQELGMPSVSDILEVNVKNCLPHRSSIPAYPYGAGFQANHTCCKGNPNDPAETEWGSYYDSAQECYNQITYSCKPTANIEYPPADKAVKEITLNSGVLLNPENVDIFPSVSGGDANDIYKRTFKQFCSGKRGNVCSGNVEDKWVVFKNCNSKNTSKGEDESCQGPFSGVTKNICPPYNVKTAPTSCYNYSPGKSFERNFLGTVTATGICNKNPKCSIKGSNDGYSSLSANAVWACKATCDGSGNCDNTRTQDCECADSDTADNVGMGLNCGAKCDDSSDFNWIGNECKINCNSNCVFSTTQTTKCNYPNTYCLNGDYCYINVGCSSTGASETEKEYCPAKGTINNNICYYGTRNCNSAGKCALSKDNCPEFYIDAKGNTQRDVSKQQTCFYSRNCNPNLGCQYDSISLRKDYCDHCTSTGVNIGDYSPDPNNYICTSNCPNTGTRYYDNTPNDRSNDCTNVNTNLKTESFKKGFIYPEANKEGRCNNMECSNDCITGGSCTQQTPAGTCICS